MLHKAFCQLRYEYSDKYEMAKNLISVIRFFASLDMNILTNMRWQKNLFL